MTPEQNHQTFINAVGWQDARAAEAERDTLRAANAQLFEQGEKMFAEREALQASLSRATEALRETEADLVEARHHIAAALDYQPDAAADAFLAASRGRRFARATLLEGGDQ